MPKGRLKKTVAKEDVVVKVGRLNLNEQPAPPEEIVAKSVTPTVKGTISGTFTPAPLTREDYFAISNATEGWLTEAETNLLWYTAENYWSDGCRWVEIGSYCGKSTVLLGGVLALHGAGWLQCVDPMDGNLSFPTHYEDKLLASNRLDNVGSTLEKFNATIERAGLTKIVDLIPTKFTDAHAEDGVFTLAFVDGLHDFDSVKDDWEHLKPMLTQNAIVIFHDYQKWHGPTLVVDTAIAYNELQFIEQADSLVVCRYIGAK